MQAEYHCAIVIVIVTITTIVTTIPIINMRMTNVIIRPADVCLPFTVRVGEGVGRYVVATRDIKAGQVMIMATMMSDDEDDVCGLGRFVVMDFKVSQVRLPGDP